MDRDAPEASAARPRTRRHVAYVMSRFPKLTETFVLYEMLAMRQLGHPISVYPLLRQHEEVVHPEARQMVQQATYLPFLSGAIVRSQLHHLRHQPGTYLRTLGRVIRANLGSRNYLVGALAVFPKAAHLARLMEARAVDHVHCHFSSHPAAAGFVIRRLSGIPYSFTAHGSDLHVDRHMLCEKASEAAFVVTISEYNRRLIEEHCGHDIAGRTVVIHSGVDTTVFRPGNEARDLPGMTIACIGRLIDVKGQRFLIEAARRLVADGADVRVMLVGEGPDEASLTRQVADAGLADRVMFAGSKTRDQVAHLLGKADLLVAPSVPTRAGRREGIPVALMEAMASGLPVVASALSGIPELVDDEVNGLLVTPADAAALHAAIRRLYDDPALRRRMGAAAREKVVREFSVRRTAELLSARMDALGT